MDVSVSRGPEEEHPDPPAEPSAPSVAEPGGLVLQNQWKTQDFYKMLDL